LVRT